MKLYQLFNKLNDDVLIGHKLIAIQKKTVQNATEIQYMYIII